MGYESKFNIEADLPTAVEIIDGVVIVTLIDGRKVTTPLARHPWLLRASTEQRTNVRLGIFSILWPDLDEGLDIEWMLYWQSQ